MTRGFISHNDKIKNQTIPYFAGSLKLGIRVEEYKFVQF